jgi:hypothetical protein
MAGHVAVIGKRGDRYRILVGKPEGKMPLGKPHCGWEDSIKTDFKDII